MPKLDYKKIAIVIIFLVIVIAIGFLLYFVFFRGRGEEPDVNENINAGAISGFPSTGLLGNLPLTALNLNIGLPTTTVLPGDVSPVASGGPTEVTKVSDDIAHGLTLSGDGKNLLYYSSEKDRFYRLGPDGKTTLLSDKAFYNVSNINWAPNTSKAILEYPDGSNILYNFNTEKQVTLPKHWKEFSFSSTSDQIVFKSMGTNKENRWLAISNADGSNAKRIESLGNQDATVDPGWSPNNQIIASFHEARDLERQELYFVGLYGENFKSTIVEGYGFEGKWTPKGDKMLYNVYNSVDNYNPSLWIVNAQGDYIGTGRRNIELNTWVDKCAFANDETVYCGVPKELKKGSGPFPALANNTPDYLYKINLRTGSKTLIADPYGEYNIEQIQITGDGTDLYFIDGLTGTMHNIKLK